MARHLIDWIAYLILRCALCLVQSLSLERCDRYCTIAAHCIDRTPLRRKTTDANLKLVFGDLDRQAAVRMRVAMWRHLLLMICEIAHAPRRVHRTNWRDHFIISDRDVVFPLIMDPRPTVLVTGHFGNFELAGFLTGLFGLPTTTIARPLDNPYAHDYLNQFRSLGGQHMLPKDGSAVAVQELLNRGGTLALLADQHAGAKGCWVDFFGHPTSCHKALALFVLSSRAPMVVCYNRRLRRPLQFELGKTGIADPQVGGQQMESVLALTAWYNERLEAAIRLAPEQYWWLHRRWREPPPAKKQRAVAPAQTTSNAAA